MAAGTLGDIQPQRLVFLLRRITLDLDQLGQRFAAEHRLHPTDMRALVAIMDAARAGRPMSPGRLGEELQLTSAAVTALLDRLERVGHLRRVRDPHDRRRVGLEIEPQAVALGAAFFGRLNRELLAAMEQFSEDELAAAGRVLETMGEVIAANHRTRLAAEGGR